MVTQLIFVHQTDWTAPEQRINRATPYHQYLANEQDGQKKLFFSFNF